MVRTLALAALLAFGASAAHADLLELSGFGGYTSLNMGQVNSALGNFKNSPGLSVDQTTTKDISNGYLAGLDVRTGALIPVPFFELGFKGEYVGASAPGEITGTYTGGTYDFKDDPSLVAGMLGLDFSIGIPATPLKLGVSAYGGYGEGFMRESETLAGSALPATYYDGGGFVGELEGRLDWHLVSVLSLYAFGGYRTADLGVFSAGPVKFTGVFPPGYPAPKVDFSGATGGGGLNFDF